MLNPFLLFIPPKADKLIIGGLGEHVPPSIIEPTEANSLNNPNLFAVWNKIWHFHLVGLLASFVEYGDGAELDFDVALEKCGSIYGFDYIFRMRAVTDEIDSLGLGEDVEWFEVYPRNAVSLLARVVPVRVNDVEIVREVFENGRRNGTECVPSCLVRLHALFVERHRFSVLFLVRFENICEVDYLCLHHELALFLNVLGQVR